MRMKSLSTLCLLRKSFCPLWYVSSVVKCGQKETWLQKEIQPHPCEVCFVQGSLSADLTEDPVSSGLCYQQSKMKIYKLVVETFHYAAEAFSFGHKLSSRYEEEKWSTSSCVEQVEES